MQLPSREFDYLAPPDLVLSREVWNAVFTEIGARLRGLEALGISWEAAIERVFNEALAFVRTNLEVEIEAGRAEFEAVRVAFEELQSGGFSSARIAATLAGQGGIRDVQAALSFLQGSITDGLATLTADLGKRDRIAYQFASGAVAFTAENRGGWFDLNGSFVQALPAAVDVGDGWNAILRNTGTGIVTFTGQTALDQPRIHPGDVRLVTAFGAARRTIPLFETSVVDLAISLNPIWYRTYRLRGAAALTLTLPSSPVIGETIRLLDGETTANHIIARNARTIMGLAENLVLDQRGYDISLWWNGTTWRLF